MNFIQGPMLIILELLLNEMKLAVLSIPPY